MRYFHDGLENPVPVSVVSKLEDDLAAPLPLTDEQILELARRRAREVDEQAESEIHFSVGTESGLLAMEVDGELRYFVRSWTVLLGLDDEAWGSSGAVQLPQRLIEGLEQNEMMLAVPGTRRSGGMVSSLTGQLETRRSATALATLHAISTLMYGLLRSRPVRQR